MLKQRKIPVLLEESGTLANSVLGETCLFLPLTLSKREKRKTDITDALVCYAIFLQERQKIQFYGYYSSFLFPQRKAQRSRILVGAINFWSFECAEPSEVDMQWGISDQLLIYQNLGLYEWGKNQAWKIGEHIFMAAKSWCDHWAEPNNLTVCNNKGQRKATWYQGNFACIFQRDVRTYVRVRLGTWRHHFVFLDSVTSLTCVNQGYRFNKYCTDTTLSAWVKLTLCSRVVFNRESNFGQWHEDISAFWGQSLEAISSFNVHACMKVHTSAKVIMRMSVQNAYLEVCVKTSCHGQPIITRCDGQHFRGMQFINYFHAGYQLLILISGPWHQARGMHKIWLEMRIFQLQHSANIVGGATTRRNMETEPSMLRKKSGWKEATIMYSNVG